MWSGVGSISESAQNLGCQARAFDILHGPAEDITTEQGFRKVLELTLGLVPGGLLWMAPVCSSFGGLNLKNTQRHKDIWGSNTWYVREGNHMATVAAFLFLVAWAHGAEAVIENPAASYIFSFPPVRAALAIALANKVSTPRCAWSGARIGKRWYKLYTFWGTPSWLQDLARKCPCGGARGGNHAALTTTAWVDGKLKTYGVKHALTASAAYPAKLGRTIVQCWLRASPPSAQAKSEQPPAEPTAPRKRRAWQMTGASSSTSDTSEAAVAGPRNSAHAWKTQSLGADCAEPSSWEMRTSEAAVSGPRNSAHAWKTQSLGAECAKPSSGRAWKWQ